jgi:hypothetical protein
MLNFGAAVIALPRTYSLPLRLDAADVRIASSGLNASLISRRFRAQNIYETFATQSMGSCLRARSYQPNGHVGESDNFWLSFILELFREFSALRSRPHESRPCGTRGAVNHAAKNRSAIWRIFTRTSARRPAGPFDAGSHLEGFAALIHCHQVCHQLARHRQRRPIAVASALCWSP